MKNRFEGTITVTDGKNSDSCVIIEKIKKGKANFLDSVAHAVGVFIEDIEGENDLTFDYKGDLQEDVEKFLKTLPNLMEKTLERYNMNRLLKDSPVTTQEVNKE